MKANSNFQCKECTKFFFVSRYKMVISDGEVLYKDDYDIIKCPHCKSENIIGLKKEGYGAPMIGKFSSASPMQKRAMLQKRASAHNNSKTQREFANYNEAKQTGRSL